VVQEEEVGVVQEEEQKQAGTSGVDAAALSKSSATASDTVNRAAAAVHSVWSSLSAPCSAAAAPASAEINNSNAAVTADADPSGLRVGCGVEVVDWRQEWSSLYVMRVVDRRNLQSIDVLTASLRLLRLVFPRSSESPGTRCCSRSCSRKEEHRDVLVSKAACEGLVDGVCAHLSVCVCRKQRFFVTSPEQLFCVQISNPKVAHEAIRPDAKDS
jgi:hypothetical protein